MQPIIALSENAVAGFSFPTPQPLRPPLVTIEKGQVGYDDKPVLSKLNLRLDSDDRIALLGANGEGKSTLSKLIADRLPLMAGKTFKSGKLRVGFFAQHQLDELIEGESALQHILRLRPEDTEKALRTRLGAAGFNNDIVDMPVEKLSGGQKARLLMLIATIEAPHILILDEPTNHLDIESREALVMALNEYEGAVILVSHDTHLVETVADRLWLVRDGTVVPFEGDMDEYKKLIMAGNKSQSNKAQRPNRDKKNKPASGLASEPVFGPSAATPVKKMNPVKLKSELGQLEGQMEKLGAKKQALEAEMMSANFYSAHNSAEIAAKTKVLGDITTELETVEESWLALQEQI
jgi:ATP-binding cassette subfamily F protein 3